MIIWLASYPRSGNTLLRQILWQVFDHPTYSDSNDPKDLGIHEAGAKLVGHRNYTPPWSDFYVAAKEDSTLTLVKTHHPPKDDERAIYIVRDGRAAIVSYFHLLRDLRGRTEICLDAVIRGETPLGSWSKNLDHWQPQVRPDTLLLRFEDLRHRTEQCIRSVSEFTGLAPVRPWENPLVKLREAMPGFVRHGSNRSNIAELGRADLQLFWALHGGWMNTLGYA
jgi:hypothetical protein